MIKRLLDPNLTYSQIITRIKTIDMGHELIKLTDQLCETTAGALDASRQAAILGVTNTHTATVTLHCTDNGNIGLKLPDNAPAPEQLYSVPGVSILFAMNAQPYSVQLYRLEGEYLTRAERVTVTADQPQLIDGTTVLFDSNPEGTGHSAFIGSINLPDRSADISVFDRATLRKVAWFPHDDSAARYLVALELLESARDPDARRVAEELIYHYHPAVAWGAFQMIRQADLQAALHYVPLLRNLQNTRLNVLLDQSAAA